MAEEAIRKCNRAVFIPAIYNHQVRDSYISGTIIFRVVKGKPHLRIYLNQDVDHLKQGDDFISPEAVFIPDEKYQGMRFPARGIGFSATVVVAIDVDVRGKVKSAKIIFETPPGRGFGAEVMSKIYEMTLLPGYLHGKPVACSASLQMLFKGGGRGYEWKSD